MRMRFVAAAGLAALTLPTAALAKGPVDATVSGPGLAKPLVFGGGESDGTAVMNLATAAGFWPAAYGSEVGLGEPTTKANAPTVSLGPRYTIIWNVPTGTDTADKLVQDLYPYAASRPYTYMKPGQPLFDRTTAGGWFAANASLKRLLVSAGLPSAAARRTEHGRFAPAWMFGGLGVGALTVVAAGRSGIGAWRRRSASTTKGPSV